MSNKRKILSTSKECGIWEKKPKQSANIPIREQEMLKNKKKVHDFMNAESSEEEDIVPRKTLKHKLNKEGYHFLLKFSNKTEK